MQVSYDEVIAALDPLGRALWEKAQMQVLNGKLFARIAELESAGEA